MVVQQLVVILLFLCEKVSSNPSTPVSCPELRAFYKYGYLLPISSVCAGCYPLGMGCVFVVVLPHSQDSGCHASAICSDKKLLYSSFICYSYKTLINPIHSTMKIYQKFDHSLLLNFFLVHSNRCLSSLSMFILASKNQFS